MPNKTSVALSIPSRAEYLTAVREFVSSLMQEIGWDKEQSAELEIALYEALMNVIEHSYKHSPDKEVNISIEFTPTTVIVEVEDNGSQFDSTKINVPDDADRAAKKQMIGKFLIKSFTDRIEYRSTSKGGNVLRLIKEKKP